MLPNGLPWPAQRSQGVRFAALPFASAQATAEPSAFSWACARTCWSYCPEPPPREARPSVCHCHKVITAASDNSAWCWGMLSVEEPCSAGEVISSVYTRHKGLKCTCGTSHREGKEQRATHLLTHPVPSQGTFFSAPAQSHLLWGGIKPSGWQELPSALREESLPGVPLLSVQALWVMFWNGYSCEEVRVVHEASYFYTTSCFGA